MRAGVETKRPRSDAPTSALSVIYTEHGEFEDYWFHDEPPDLVLVDTDIVAAAPVRFFRSGIADDLATWLEADATARSIHNGLTQLDATYGEKVNIGTIP